MGCRAKLVWCATSALTSTFVGLAASTAGAQDLTVLQPEGTFNGAAYGVSANGEVMVGTARVPSGISGEARAFRWTQSGGFTALSSISSEALGVSADGSVIVGVENGRATRWTAGGGALDLGLLNGGASSVAEGVSADGGVVVGSARDGNESGNMRAFRWTQGGGLQSLGTLPGGNWSNAYGVSGDGKVVVGDSRSGTSGPYSEAYRWTEADGMVELGKLNNSDSSQARAASYDGSVIVGWARDGDSQQQQAVRWTQAGGVESLGAINDGSLSIAYGVSSDGAVIVGSAADGSDGNILRAFRWTGEAGIEMVEDWLRGAGADIASNVTWHAYGVNDDGTVVVGDTVDNKMFIARAGHGGSPGLITVDDLATSLSGTGTANSAATNSIGTLLNGAGSRPLDRLAPDGRTLTWIGGDWGRDSHGSRDGELKLGELGAGHDFGGVQINGTFGISALDQDTVFGGRSDVASQYVKVELLAPLGGTAESPLWGIVTATGLWGEGDIDRGYLVNAGVQDTSYGNADTEGYGIRGRLQWQNLLPYVSPYGELSFARACLDSYTEVGGAFPASFDRLCDEATETRIGFDATVPVSSSFRLTATLEGVHRFEEKGSNVTGQVIGLGAFNLGQADYEQTWLRAGAGFEVDVGRTTFALMGNATTKGESADAWVAANWRMRL